MKALYIILVTAIIHANVQAQVKQDSVRSQSLDSVTISTYLKQSNLQPLQDIQGTYIFAGKKTEMINLKQHQHRRLNAQRFILVRVFGPQMEGA